MNYWTDEQELSFSAANVKYSDKTDHISWHELKTERAEKQMLLAIDDKKLRQRAAGKRNAGGFFKGYMDTACKEFLRSSKAENIVKKYIDTGLKKEVEIKFDEPIGVICTKEGKMVLSRRARFVLLFLPGYVDRYTKMPFKALTLYPVMKGEEKYN